MKPYLLATLLCLLALASSAQVGNIARRFGLAITTTKNHTHAPLSLSPTLTNPTHKNPLELPSLTTATQTNQHKIIRGEFSYKHLSKGPIHRLKMYLIASIACVRHLRNNVFRATRTYLFANRGYGLQYSWQPNPNIGTNLKVAYFTNTKHATHTHSTSPTNPTILAALPNKIECQIAIGYRF